MLWEHEIVGSNPTAPTTSSARVSGEYLRAKDNPEPGASIAAPAWELVCWGSLDCFSFDVWCYPSSPSS